MMILEVTGSNAISFDQKVESIAIPSILINKIRVNTKAGIASIVTNYMHNPVYLVADASIIADIIEVSPCRITFNTGVTFYDLEHCYIAEDNKTIVYRSCILTEA